MTNSTRKTGTTLTTTRRIAGLTVCLAASALAAGTDAQRAMPRLVLRSGLYSFHPGQMIRGSVVATGASTATALVRIDLRDDADRLVSRVEGVLTRTSPVRLDHEVTGETGLVQLRADIVIVGDPDVTRPMTTLEGVDRDSQTVQRLVACGPPSWLAGPPNRSEGPQTLCHCPELTVTILPAGQ
jgi:hypothetical protein